MPLVPFISAQDLQEYLKYPTDALDEALTVIALDAACDIIRDECNITFNHTEDVEIDVRSSSDILLLDEYPVTEIEVTENGTVIAVDDDFELDSDRGILHRKPTGTRWSRATDEPIHIKYSFGYETIPASVRIVALEVAAKIYEVGIEDGGTSLTEAQQKMLYRYKRVY